MTLTIGKGINLAAAVAGCAGTILLFNGSFAYETPTALGGGNHFEEMAKRNRWRKFVQRAGLTLILVGFALGGIAQFFD